MITVLFARRDSVYKRLGCDVWDEERDVRNYHGTGPVVCHPPCRLWGRLGQFAKAPDPMEHLWPWWCIDLIDEYGGVLEHPITSKVWKRVKPTTVVDQYWFGHRARKRTGLYINGNIPPIPFTLRQPDHKRDGVNNMNVAERERTPERFARWLMEACLK